MDFGGGGAKAESDRCVSISEQLLAARDLVGSKRFAERALELDPTSSPADRVLAAVDILLAAQSPCSSPYSILQLDPSSPAAASPSSLSRQFRRLSLLLRSSTSPTVAAAFDAALTLISEAFSLLSDPSKLKAHPSSTPVTPPPPPQTTDSTSSFWTACHNCCCVHEYAAEHCNKMIRCPACRSAFRAVELPTPPPIVPGANLYYCSWGFFPIGYPSANDFENKNWKPFYPMYPWLGNQPPPPSAAPAVPPNNVNLLDDPESEPEPRQQPASRGRKKTARKRVGSHVKRKAVGNDGGRGGGAIAAGGGGGGGISINLQGTNAEDILGNLQNLPFLKDDIISIHIPGNL